MFIHQIDREYEENVGAGDNMDAERELCQAILKTAWLDARTMRRSTTPYERRQAKAWLTTTSPELRFICGIAGLNVHAVLERARSVLLARKGAEDGC